MKKWPFFTLIVTIIYCFLCFFSAGAVHYGAYHADHRIFDLGRGLIYLWIMNPIGILFPIIGIIKSKPKWFYVLCMGFTTLSWLAAGAIIAVVF